jgi:hypothetical protein
MIFLFYFIHLIIKTNNLITYILVYLSLQLSEKIIFKIHSILWNYSKSNKFKLYDSNELCQKRELKKMFI